MGKVSDYVRQIVGDKLRRHGVVVWYDKPAAFRNLVRQWCLPDVTVFVWHDSWLRVRHEADRWLLGNVPDLLTRQKMLLVYVPTARGKDEQDLLLPLWKAGCRFGDGPGEDLAGLAREALRDTLSGGEFGNLLDNVTVTLEDLDAVAETCAGWGLLALIFGTTASHEVASRFVLDEDAFNQVVKRGALEEVRRYLRVEFGLDVPVGGASELRQELSRFLLLGEFLSDFRGEQAYIRGTLGKVRVPERPKDQDVCCRACRHMRETASLAEGYARLARQTETEFNFLSSSFPEGEVVAGDTFAFQDEARLALVTTLAQDGKLDEAEAVVARARQSFWVRQVPTRAVIWNVVGYALQVLREASRAKAEAKTLRGKAATRWLTAYAGPPSGNRVSGGWYRLDTAHRLMEQQLRHLDEDVGVAALLSAARAEYGRAVTAMAGGFQVVLESQDFDLGGLSQQSGVFDRYVRPRLDSGRTAYFLVDALRYEMAMNLAECLRREADVSCEPCWALAPSITPVGMAALMPGAEEGVELLDENGDLAVLVKGRELGSSGARMDYLRTRHPDTVDLRLEEVLGWSAKKLAQRLEGTRLVAVRSREIDEYGERGNDYQAHKYMSDIIDDLLKASRLLARAGFERQVFAADHGYLFLPEGYEGSKVEPPGGHTTCLHRRSWVGRGGRIGPSLMRVPAVKMGIGGDLELAFPQGLGVFSGGGGSYCHGGLTLQELIVPVVSVVLKPRAPASTRRGRPQVEIVFPPGRITNRIFSVEVTYQGEQSESVAVTAEVVCGNKRVGALVAANTGYDPAARRVTLEGGCSNALILQLAEGGPRTGIGEIVILDVASGMKLGALTAVPIDLAY